MNLATIVAAEQRLARRFPRVQVRHIEQILFDSLHTMRQVGTDPRILDNKAIALTCLRLELAYESPGRGSSP
jgi:hypothetical protein